MPDRERWNERAAAAEYAVLDRYVRRTAGLSWGRATWPARRGIRGVADELRVWHYWWHAHLLDAAGDAERHRPSPGRRRRIAMLARTVAARTGGRWVNRYYDDIAWMGLALLRAAPARHRAIGRIADRLERGIDPRVGAVPWHVGSDLFNAPANGPASILLARLGRRGPAEALADWMARELTDPATGLVRDGVEPSGVRLALYTYNQGVAIGAALALAAGGAGGAGAAGAAGGAGAAGDRHAARAAELVRAVHEWCRADDGLFPSPGGGDGGLFAGILSRYLAEAAVLLDRDERTADAAASARRLVLANARALWDGRAVVAGRPLFAADPRRHAVVPTHPVRPRLASAGAVDPALGPDGDLSVQLSAWLTLEAAASLPR